MISREVFCRSKGHDLEEALLALQVVLQGGLRVVDGGVPRTVLLEGLVSVQLPEMFSSLQ